MGIPPGFNFLRRNAETNQLTQATPPGNVKFRILRTMTILNLQISKVKKKIAKTVFKYLEKNAMGCAHFVSLKKLSGMCQNDLLVNWLKLFLITETTLGLCERVGEH